MEALEYTARASETENNVVNFETISDADTWYLVLSDPRRDWPNLW